MKHVGPFAKKVRRELRNHCWLRQFRHTLSDSLWYELDNDIKEAVLIPVAYHLRIPWGVTYGEIQPGRIHPQEI
jgi:hypothetical protein